MALQGGVGSFVVIDMNVYCNRARPFGTGKDDWGPVKCGRPVLGSVHD